jgi:hypothetical protein
MSWRQYDYGDSKDDLQFDFEHQSLALIPATSMSNSVAKLQIEASDTLSRSFESNSVLGLPPSAPVAISNRRANKGGLTFGDFPPGFPAASSVICESRSVTDKRIALYKTEICRTFEETGQCRYGLKCQFAHHMGELRMAPKHPRYKTEICRTYWESGTCPYGKRCCFIHNESSINESGKIAASLPVSCSPNTESRILGRLEKLSTSPPCSSVTDSPSVNRNRPNDCLAVFDIYTVDKIARTRLLPDAEITEEERESDQHLTEDILRLVDE